MCIRDSAITSALIGARTVKQLKENLAALDNLEFSKKEIKEINKTAKEGDINIWAPSSAH